VLLLQEKRNFRLEIHVDPKHHPKIIGRKGAVISRIRQDHNVNIQLPDQHNTEQQDVLTIIGYEKDTHAARDEINKLVSEFVSNRNNEPIF
jgi:predicted PilT family ATPase